MNLFLKAFCIFGLALGSAHAQESPPPTSAAEALQRLDPLFEMLVTGNFPTIPGVEWGPPQPALSSCSLDTGQYYRVNHIDPVPRSYPVPDQYLNTGQRRCHQNHPQSFSFSFNKINEYYCFSKEDLSNLNFFVKDFDPDTARLFGYEGFTAEKIVGQRWYYFIKRNDSCAKELILSFSLSGGLE